jgi:hypothetical protein
MSSGPAPRAAAGCEDLAAARALTWGLAFPSGFGRVTALTCAAGLLGDDAGGVGSAVLVVGFAAALFIRPRAGTDSAAGAAVADTGAPGATGGFGTVELPRAGGFPVFPGGAESPPTDGLTGFREGVGDGLDPDGVGRFLAIDLSGA